MSTFLEIVRAVRQEAGVPGTATTPITTVGQVGELKKIVDWTRDSWAEIQNMRPDWNFKWTEFSATWDALEPTQVAAGVGKWERDDFSYYPIGSPERKQSLQWVEYRDFKRMYENRPLTDSAYPTVITYAPDKSLRVNCIPQSSFILLGKYFRTAQILDADDEIPLLDYDWHDWIKWQAVMRYAGNDEATLIYQYARDMAMSWKARAVNEMLPEIRLDGAVALGEDW